MNLWRKKLPDLPAVRWRGLFLRRGTVARRESGVSGEDLRFCEICSL